MGRPASGIKKQGKKRKETPAKTNDDDDVRSFCSPALHGSTLFTTPKPNNRRTPLFDSTNRKSSATTEEVTPFMKSRRTMALLKSSLDEELPVATIAENIASIVRLLIDESSISEFVNELSEQLDLPPPTATEDPETNDNGTAPPGTPAVANATTGAALTPTPARAKKDMTPVEWNPDIFNFDQHNPTIPVTNKHTIDSRLKRCKKGLVEAFRYCGSPQHIAFILRTVLCYAEFVGVGVLLGMIENPDLESRVAKEVLDNTRGLLNSGHVLRSSTNQAITAMTTLFKFTAPSAPDEGCDNDTERAHKRRLSEHASVLKLRITSEAWEMRLGHFI